MGLAFIVKLSNRLYMESGIDFNDLFTREVKARVTVLEKLLQEKQENNESLTKELDSYKASMSKLDLSESFLDVLRRTYTSTDLYGILCKLVEAIYGYKAANIADEVKKFDIKVSINLYPYKKEAVELIKLIEPLYDISYIESFLMPRDYSKEHLMKIISNPHEIDIRELLDRYNSEWLINPMGKSFMTGRLNTPYPLLMENPYILDDEVFDLIISKASNYAATFWNYLFVLLLLANPKLSAEQSRRIGEIIGRRMPSYMLSRTSIMLRPYSSNIAEYLLGLIVSNLHKFDFKTLDSMYDAMNYGIKIKWHEFPYPYQVKFIESLNAESAFECLSSSHCNWVYEDRINMLIKLKAQSL
jgi:hypothetical protein